MNPAFTPEHKQALETEGNIFEKFVDLTTPNNEIIRVYTGYGKIRYKTFTYLGYGELIDIEEAPQTGRLQLSDVSITLSRVSEVVQDLGNIDLRGQTFTISLGIITPNRRIIGDLIQRQTATIDNTFFSKAQDTDIFIIHGTVGITNFRNPDNRTLSAQHQVERLERGKARTGNYKWADSYLDTSGRLPVTRFIQDNGFDVIEENVTNDPGWVFSPEPQPAPSTFSRIQR